MNKLPVEPENVWTVSAFNTQIRQQLETAWGRVWISGEISNLTKAQSGHVYFSLKDPQSQIRCALFKKSRDQSFAEDALKNGSQVTVWAQVSVYVPRGEYQLIVETVQAEGQGLLAYQFEQLKQKLAKEGLFDPARKQSIPTFPQRIGIITSPTGAALQDILHVLNRRMPLIPIRVYPATVQGEQAPSSLRNALSQALCEACVSVLIIARGGGSMEDLWGFNDPALARMIAYSTVPIISGVGHEIDYTICDFVADLRAPTPSAAAEMATLDKTVWLARLQEARECLQRAWRQLYEKRRMQWEKRHARLLYAHPLRHWQMHYQRLDYLQTRLTRIKQSVLQAYAQAHSLARHRLLGLSPFGTLERGYAIVQGVSDGKKPSAVAHPSASPTIVDSAAQALQYTCLSLQFKDGTVTVRDPKLTPQ